MKASELRIGNYVKRKSSNTPLRIENFVMDSVHFNRSKKPYFSKVSNIEPIPLTEDWLLMFGFDYLDSLSMYEKNGFGFKKSDINTIHYDYGLCSLSIKYVHQLQNLYFALTGDELELKGTNLNKPV